MTQINNLGCGICLTGLTNCSDPDLLKTIVVLVTITTSTMWSSGVYIIANFCGVKCSNIRV